jgi:hypothetical protein
LSISHTFSNSKKNKENEMMDEDISSFLHIKIMQAFKISLGATF